MNNFKDLKNHKFGRLTVLEQDGFHVNPNSGKRYAKWLVKCECGVEKCVVGGNLTSGHTLSCGCLKTEVSSRKGKILAKANRKEGTSLRNKFNEYKQSAKSRNISFELDFELFSTLMTSNCVKCAAPPKENLSHYNSQKTQAVKNGREFDESYALSQIISVNGIDRKNASLGYVGSNCQTLCGTCNISKGAHEQRYSIDRHNADEAFINHCLAVVKNNFIIVNNELILKEQNNEQTSINA